LLLPPKFVSAIFFEISTKLKSQPGLSGCFGQSLDSAVITIPVTVKTDTLYADTHSLLGDRNANSLGGFPIAALGKAATQILRTSTGRGKRNTGNIINNLGINVPA
jgi:hypothetical protein